MSTSSNKLALKQKPPIEPIALVATPITPAPAPDPGLASAKAAVKHCCAAWQRANKAYALQHKVPEDCYVAEVAAGRAYCNAMPVLSGLEGIRDFIACAAQGTLIGAIPGDRSGQLLYAAQVALNALNFQPKPPQTPSK